MGQRKKKQITVGGAFKSSVIELSEKLMSTHTLYVRTIKPNSLKSRKEFDRAMTLKQLKCSGAYMC